MFDFSLNVYFLITLASILIIVFLLGKNSWSSGVILKEPKALVINNAIFIIVALFMIVEIIFSWKAGVIIIVLAFIVLVLSGRMAMKKHLAKNQPKVKGILK